MAAGMRKRWGVTAAIGATLAIGVALLFVPRAVPVDIAKVTRGLIEESVSDLGQAQVRDAFIAAAPVSGRLERIPLKVGDRVTEGLTLVARIRPADALLLDPSVRAQREAALVAARAQRDQFDAERTRAAAVLARAQALAQQGFNSAQSVDDAQAAAQAAAEAVSTAQAQVRAAEAALIGPEAASRGSVTVMAPVSGLVTRVLEPSERTLAAGVPLVEISDHAALEAAIEFLSQDAVRIREGMDAEIYDWGGPGRIPAVVRRVEPTGFTKISALGVEEQRALVRLQFKGDARQWERLAVGYRVWGRVVLRREAAALKAPLGALVRADGRWAVYRVEDARARLRTVEVGALTDRDAEIRSGLREGDMLVMFPSDEVADGVRITAQR